MKKETIIFILLPILRVCAFLGLYFAIVGAFRGINWLSGIGGFLMGVGAATGWLNISARQKG